MQHLIEMGYTDYWNVLVMFTTDGKMAASNDTICDMPISNGCIVRFSWDTDTISVQRNPSKTHAILCRMAPSLVSQRLMARLNSVVLMTCHKKAPVGFGC